MHLSFSALQYRLSPSRDERAVSAARSGMAFGTYSVPARVCLLVATLCLAGGDQSQASNNTSFVDFDSVRPGATLRTDKSASTGLSEQVAIQDASNDSVARMVARQQLSEQDKAIQRRYYLEAMARIRAGSLTGLEAARHNLQHYPLLPYLEYEALTRRISTAPEQAIDEFLAKYQGDYLADKLHYHWLANLARQRRWQAYLKYFNADSASVSERCHYLMALHNTGKSNLALKQTRALWLNGHSQPKACDPVFDRWIDSKHRSNELVWERLFLAIDAGNSSLARYLSKLLPASEQAYATTLLKLYRYPNLLAKSRYQQEILSLAETDDPQKQQIVTRIIRHSFARLVRKDPGLAVTIIDRYRVHLDDSPGKLNAALVRSVALALSREDNQAAKHWLLQQDANFSQAELTEFRIRLALEQQDWQQVYQWLQLLPEEQRQKDEWRYWQARSQMILGREPFQPELQSASLMRELAKERSYYGFIAADYTDQNYAMNHLSPQKLSLSGTPPLDNPAIDRALELFAVSDLRSARHEWARGSRDLSKEELLQAGELAKRHGWYQQAILSMARAENWDVLDLRFPLAFENEITNAGQKNAIDPNWIYAIARQESAFASDAKSSAGALGLLQLMPSTAKSIGRKMGIKLNYYDILQADTNISLGSYYLSELLERFNGNRIFATAAYNAGPYRVSKWIEADRAELPVDVWIETIPYKETRQYVKNVLTYSAIYAYLRAQGNPLDNNSVAQDSSSSPSP